MQWQLTLASQKLRQKSHWNLSWEMLKILLKEGRNPSTGKTIQIAAKNVVKFKAGADLGKAVN